jgi:hypothetical protein
VEVRKERVMEERPVGATYPEKREAEGRGESEKVAWVWTRKQKRVKWKKRGSNIDEQRVPIQKSSGACGASKHPWERMNDTFRIGGMWEVGSGVSGE